MTRDECKALLVEKINSLGGVRADEFVSWSLLYTIEGFGKVFHPDMLKQLAVEHKITIIEYKLPDKEKPLTFLLPRDTMITVINGKVES